MERINANIYYIHTLFPPQYLNSESLKPRITVGFNIGAFKGKLGFQLSKDSDTKKESLLDIRFQTDIR
jgi:hypothetical protein